MNIIVAIDSFKGSLTSLQAGTAAEQGILRALPDACLLYTSIWQQKQF